VSETKLAQKNEDLKSVNEVLSTLNSGVDALQNQLSEAEQERKKSYKAADDEIAEQIRLTKNAVHKQQTVTAENQKIRSEKELVYRTLLQRLHREKDGTLKLERKMRQMSSEVEKQRLMFDKEEKRLEQILTAAIMDRDMAKQDYDVIQEQVDQLRDVVSPVDTTVKKSTVLTKQKSAGNLLGVRTTCEMEIVLWR
jgi:hypothetical protein